MTLGGISAAMPGGSWLGAITSGYISDILGRKKAIQIGAVIWCVGSSMSGPFDFFSNYPTQANKAM